MLMFKVKFFEGIVSILEMVNYKKVQLIRCVEGDNLSFWILRKKYIFSAKTIHMQFPIKLILFFYVGGINFHRFK